MDDLHLRLLSDMAFWAHQHSERVALDSSVLLALLTEIHTLRQERDEAVKRAAEMQVTLETIDIPMGAVEVVDLRESAQAALVCPICGADHFKDARGLGGHIWGKHHIRASEMKAE